MEKKSYINMYLLTIFASLLNFFFCFFFGRYSNRLYVSILSTINILISLCLSVLCFYEVCLCKSNTSIILFDWICVDLLETKWNFVFDALTSTMLIVILSISLCAHIYSIEYMWSDPNFIKYMSYLSLFTFFMLILVTSSNFALLFLGWEGVGISSYLLINFWHTRITANKSAIMAIIVNKVGDISLLLAICIMYSLYTTSDYSVLLINTIFIKNNFLEIPLIYYVLCILLITAAVGKSAQIGLHMWLPEAMEGPTPVSSLIHAATMVTAGIYLIIRANIFFTLFSDVILIIIVLGSTTAFMASSIGIFQYDIKKIIAYSTCSQLGYMFLACGLNAFEFSLYHLINHAFFKALLFLTAGYVIHGLSNKQDLRKFGGLLKIFPLAYVFINIGNLSLLGFPFTSGYFSKEKIIELFYGINYNTYSSIYYTNIIFFFQCLSNIAIIFTICYSIKILIYTFIYNFQSNKFELVNFHYSSVVTVIPLCFLSILSIISGYFLEDMIVGLNSDLYNENIFSTTHNNIFFFEFNTLSNVLPVLSTIYWLLMFFLMFFYGEYNFLKIKFSYEWSNAFINNLNKKYVFINKNIYYPLINFFFRISYKYMYVLLDKGIIEIWGPFGLSKTINYYMNFNDKWQTGFIYHYMGLLILNFVVTITVLLSL